MGSTAKTKLLVILWIQPNFNMKVFFILSKSKYKNRIKGASLKVFFSKKARVRHAFFSRQSTRINNRKRKEEEKNVLRLFGNGPKSAPKPPKKEMPNLQKVACRWLRSHFIFDEARRKFIIATIVAEVRQKKWERTLTPTASPPPCKSEKFLNS